MTNNIRKHGFPVLAYSTLEPGSPWLCSLLFKHSDKRKQATISLKSSISIHGFEDEQIFMFQYDADNLVPGTSSLGPATIPLPQTRLDEIARQAAPQMRTLSLSIKETCPIWCPRFSGPIAPKPGFDTPFHQLVKLAKATAVHILFDYNWLHKDHQPSFQRFISQEEGLTGFPVGAYYAEHYRLADWTVFSPFDAAQAPPSYAESSNKRPRQATSPTPSPPSKRVLLDESQTQTHIPTSPTERATTSSIDGLSPKPLQDDLNASDFHTAAINRAVARHLPSALEQVLPNILPTLFTIAPPSSPDSSVSVSCLPSQPPPETTPLGALLTTHIHQQLQPYLSSLYDSTISHASALHESADAEFFESLEDAKVDLMMIREDGVDELSRVGIRVLEECKEKVEDVVEDVEERMWEVAQGVFEDVQERIRGLERVRCERCERDRSGKDKGLRGRGQGRGRRGGRGGYKGLGIR